MRDQNTIIQVDFEAWWAGSQRLGTQAAPSLVSLQRSLFALLVCILLSLSKLGLMLRSMRYAPREGPMRPSSTYFPIKTLFLVFATIFTLLSACVPMEEEGMEVLEGKKREPVLLISPNSGPSGTSARITLTQAIPFAEVVLDLGAETKYGESNEDGEWITTYTFTGAAGDQLNVQARIGAPVEESASATFRTSGS